MEKVLHIVAGMNIGGTETMLINLNRALKDKIRFDFISYYDFEGYYDKEIEEIGGKVIRLDNPNKIGRLKSIIQLAKFIRKNNYKIVHMHTMFNCGLSSLGAFLGGAKVRISHAHTTAYKTDSILKKVYIFFMRILIRIFSTDYLACSESAGSYLFGKKIIKNKRYRTLPNYIDYEKIIRCNDRNSIREELGITEKEILIGHVGRFTTVKNHSFLLKVIKEMKIKNKNIKAIFVGYGELLNEIKNEIKDLDLEGNVFLLGIREDIDKIMNNIDLFVMPSIYEGLGLVLLEAQAAGVPCLVSEAIQKEADINFGLINKKSLNDTTKSWGEEAFKILSRKEKIEEEAIREEFKKKGYDIESLSRKFFEIYERKNRG